MTAGITISADLPPLPLDAVTSTFAILAKKGAGKTHTASVIAEEMIGAGLRICVFDPVGAWWGLRSSFDGERPGLPVVVFGGERADVELDEGMGTELADLVVDGSFSCVIDTSLLETKASQIRFALAFAKRIYHRNRAPLHLFLDEADMLAPQKPMGEDAHLLGAVENIVRRGRQRGLGVTMITQRAAVLNKNVLSQIDTLLILRTTSPQDRDALDAWIEAQASKEERKQVIDTLPSLKTGEAWIWSPSMLSVLARVQIRRRRTFDSSATPKVGEVRVEPKQLAPVDINAIRAALAPKEADDEELVEKLDASRVVRRLQTRIEELEGQLAEPRPLLDEATRAELLTTMSQATTVTAALSNATTLAESVRRLADVLEATVRGAQPVISVEHEPVIYGPGTHLRDIDPPAPPMPTTRGAAAVSPGARRMLVALATFHPKPLTRAQLATLSEFSPKGGGFRNVLSELATQTLIEKQGESVRATPDGLRLAGRVQRPTSTAELVSTWSAKLGTGAQRMLGVLVRAYPGWVTRGGLASNVAMEAGGGGFRNCLSELSTNGLIEKRGKDVRASEAFFIGARR